MPEADESSLAKPNDIEATPRDKQIAQLERQLALARESLRRKATELEDANKKLLAINQELVLSNQELQRSNEDQLSTNEELHTINAEFQAKIAELTAANSDIDLLLKISNMGILFLDNDLRVRRFSKEILTIINVVRHDIGRPISDIAFNFSNDQILSLVMGTLGTGKSGSHQAVHNGVTYIIQCSPYYLDRPISSPQHKESGVVVTFLDISAIKEAKELKRLTQDTEEFTYAVSHDLRRPIRSLRQAANRLTDEFKKAGLATEAVNEGSDAMLGSIHRLEFMLDSLLRYSRLRTRGGKFVPFSPKNVVAQIAEKLGRSFDDVVIEVGVLPASIYGDATQFRELISNLFENSITHRIPGRSVRIELSSRDGDGVWEFVVKDNGPGFGKVASEKAFDLFVKGPHVHDTEERLGLGLAYSRRIVQRHGGEIWINPRPKNGSAVHFTLAMTGIPRI